MTDRDLLKLKLGFAIAAMIFLLIGSKMLFDNWTLIPWPFWLLTVFIEYRGIYLTTRTLTDKKEVVFKGFATVETISWVIGVTLATVTLFIFYPLASLLFYGLTFISLLVYGGLQFK